MLKKITLAFACTFVLFSCTETQNDDANSSKNTSNLSKDNNLISEVMKIHDDVMPKMDKIIKIRTELSELKQQVDSTKNSQGVKNINAQIVNLMKADEAMMNWMRNYQEPQDPETDRAKKYLKSELKKVTLVTKEMNESIEKGSKMLDSLKSTKK
jgi:hypothetical protein